VDEAGNAYGPESETGDESESDGEKCNDELGTEGRSDERRGLDFGRGQEGGK